VASKKSSSNLDPEEILSLEFKFENIFFTEPEFSRVPVLGDVVISIMVISTAGKENIFKFESKLRISSGSRLLLLFFTGHIIFQVIDRLEYP